MNIHEVHLLLRAEAEAAANRGYPRVRISWWPRRLSRQRRSTSAHAARPLARVQDDVDALRILSELLARLCVVAAPPGVRRLADVATALLERSLPPFPDARTPIVS